MIKLMVSVYDKVAKEHGEIVLVNNTEVAERFFRQQVLNKVQNPDDYELYKHGYYNMETGVISDYESDTVLKPFYLELGE